MQQIRDQVAATLGVSEADQALLLPSGKQTTYSNRIAWALTHMGKAGLVSRPARAHYALTERGREVLRTHPARIDMAVLSTFPEYQAFRAPRRIEAGAESQLTIAPGDTSPSESVGALIKAADQAVAEELLDLILAQSPAFLERLALRLLAAMGYGGRETLLEHTGRSGDAGLDGLIRQDALGLDLIGVQAKRYDREATVDRPALQAFVGALQGAQTNRGIFVTTARFTTGATRFAESVNMQLRLIDGAELTRLMVRYNVGTSVREIFELKQVDTDFFEEQ
jgi:restriction system protein